jgi:CheY-like chemotaxis protein
MRISLFTNARAGLPGVLPTGKRRAATQAAGKTIGLTSVRSPHNTSQMQTSDDESVRKITVKVFGFSDAERHLLSTGFRLCESSNISYSTWTAESVQQPEIVLIDGDSWEAMLELAHPEHDLLKLIWVGECPPANAWQNFSRPLQWSRIIDSINQFYAPTPALTTSSTLSAKDDGPALDFDLDRRKPEPSVDLHFDLGAESHAHPPAGDGWGSGETEPARLSDHGWAYGETEPARLSDHDHDHDWASCETEPARLEPAHAGGTALPGSRVLVIDAESHHLLYWRAKLGVSGLVLVDDAVSADAARELLRLNSYKLVVLDLGLDGRKPWKLIREITASMKKMASAGGGRHLLVTGDSLTMLDMFRAWLAGASSMRKPLHPKKLKLFLQKFRSDV